MHLQAQRVTGDRRIASKEEIEQMEGEITALIDDAVDWAEKSPYPDPADVTKGVYCEDQ